MEFFLGDEGSKGKLGWMMDLLRLLIEKFL